MRMIKCISKYINTECNTLLINQIILLFYNYKYLQYMPVNSPPLSIARMTYQSTFHTLARIHPYLSRVTLKPTCRSMQFISER